MIPQGISRAFPGSVKERGEGYFTSQRVQRVRITDGNRLTATVAGTEKYSVQLSAQPKEMTATCTCPYAADNGACKHLWATLRYAETHGELAVLLRITGSSPSFAALSDYHTDDYDLDSAGAFVDPEDDDMRTEPASAPGKGWTRIVQKAKQELADPVTTPVNIIEEWPADRRIIYIVDFVAAWNNRGIPIELATEQQDGNGGWKSPVLFRFTKYAWQSAPDPLDRQLAQMLLGAPFLNGYGAGPIVNRFVLTGAAINTTLPLMCATGRCRIRTADNPISADAMRWDDGPPWHFHLRIERAGDDFAMSAELRRESAIMSLTEPTLLHSHGILVVRSTFAPFDFGGAFSFVSALRESAPVQVPQRELPALLESLFTLPRRPMLHLPAGTEVSESRDIPVAGAVIRTDTRSRNAQTFVDPFFLYGTVRVRSKDGPSSLFDRDTLTVRHRDTRFETTSLQLLGSLGVREKWEYSQRRTRLGISATKVVPMVARLLEEGWRVEADGSLYRPAVVRGATVRSGIDWFELEAGASFGDMEVSLSELLRARQGRGTTILLPDGSRGLIPVDWLAKLGPLVAGGTLKDGTLRFSRSQTGLLDALLATVPDADIDATFERARNELRSFSSVEPQDPPRTFRGVLREYQREGLGWLHFLRNFGLGGCLADDMGLGKTVQVLALLDSRKGTAKKPSRPSLVVVPRSLVFNWLREAERFTPRLRLLDYTGIDRDVNEITKGDVDIVITTYGILRSDAAQLANIQFDYAILDEAQAIKTASSASAKAARLLRADHRLVMTGTPIENRLEELWSLFEFLNPGMFGTSSSFGKLARIGDPGDKVPSNREVLARALRPVVLRRKKEQVARDLPERVEQTLTVELESGQRKFYDELLGEYRISVLEKVDRFGLGRSRMHILEALLRLRQAACHPVLADPSKAALASAKLDALLPAIEQVVEEGHKALVFSQFTSFLALLRERLDNAGMRYEYLDGKTRNRQICVDRFQDDAECPLFLISLKAGGHGLNLTAADYVFILDPWWNPAVEAQAIDRAHRIGQTRRVIATRIVAVNTIETKILELQESKRALAEAILGQDQGVLAGIGRAELEMLLT